MLPKKNIGAITVMTAFLGMGLTHICTALIYYSYSKAETVNIEVPPAAKAVQVLEFLFILALAVGSGMFFVYGDNSHSMALTGTAALLAVSSAAARMGIVAENSNVYSAVVMVMNLSLLGIFAVYALFFYKREMKGMALAAGISGLWVSILSVVCRVFTTKLAPSGTYFLMLAVFALISAACYFVAYYSQRQSIE